MIRTILLATAAWAALSLPQPVHAQEGTDDGATVLPPLLITAGRTPVEQEASGRAFTVITGEELERSQTRYLADALRRVPGFHVSRAGSFGAPTQVRVRGSEGNHVLVLIDGVEVSSVSQGEFDFGGLPVGDVDRIEVLRGPQSALYGSDALAGVINVITKRGPRDGFEALLQSETGTDGTFLGGVAVRGGTEWFDAAVSARFRRTDGFNLSDFGTEKDGDENLTLTGRFTLDVNDNLVIDANGRMVDRFVETDRQDFAFPATPTQGLVIDSDDTSDVQELSGAIGATWTSLDGAWTHGARFSGSGDERDSARGGVVTSTNKGNRLKAEVQSSYMFETPALLDAIHTVTGAYEWEQERFWQTATQERVTQSFVAEYRGEFAGQFYLNAAVRHDMNDPFKDATTYSVAGAWAVPGTGTRLHASVGTGVKNPTFFEQFGFVPGSFRGNPDLRPEESLGWDIGIEQSLWDGLVVVDVTWFDQNLENEIQGFGQTVRNLNGTSHRQGVELSATAELFDGFSTTAMYTYTDATDPNGMREVRRPMHSASLSAAYTFYQGRAQLFGEVIYNGAMDDLEFINATPQTRVTLDDYVLVNIGGSFKVNETVEVYGRVENLLDERYEEVFGYNTQGRAAFAGVKARF
ncbi:TonB-dependent receptor plug domain-containing protein [Oceaniradius stylonematis]|uniref:TonB-dependent receptor plug domain-containing protein n=1 Tax=Oceaniradius stylonematis TaxID=2184161 RepID=UPI0035D04947